MEQQILRLLCSGIETQIQLAETLAIGQGINLENLLKEKGFYQIQIYKSLDFLFLNTKIKKGDFAQYSLQNLDTLAFFPKITRLNCSSFNLTSLEPILSLPNAIHLQYLDCSHNRLSNLEGIENLKILEYLNCSDNLLKHLDELKTLAKLRDVVCASNQLEQINGLTASAKSLRELLASCNELTNVDILADFENLEWVYLHDNNLQSFPLVNFPKLKVLTLHKNTHLPDNLATALQLTNPHANIAN